MLLGNKITDTGCVAKISAHVNAPASAPTSVPVSPPASVPALVHAPVPVIGRMCTPNPIRLREGFYTSVRRTYGKIPVT